MTSGVSDWQINFVTNTTRDWGNEVSLLKIIYIKLITVQTPLDRKWSLVSILILLLLHQWLQVSLQHLEQVLICLWKFLLIFQRDHRWTDLSNLFVQGLSLMVLNAVQIINEFNRVSSWLRIFTYTYWALATVVWCFHSLNILNSDFHLSCELWPCKVSVDLVRMNFIWSSSSSGTKHRSMSTIAV